MIEIAEDRELRESESVSSFWTLMEALSLLPINTLTNNHISLTASSNYASLYSSLQLNPSFTARTLTLVFIHSILFNFSAFFAFWVPTGMMITTFLFAEKERRSCTSREWRLWIEANEGYGCCQKEMGGSGIFQFHSLVFFIIATVITAFVRNPKNYDRATAEM